MFCEKCGAQIAPGEMFCGNCGARVSAAPQPAVRHIYPTATQFKRPTAGGAAGAMGGGKTGLVISGLGILMLIWCLLPFIKVSFWGVNVHYNLFQMGQAGRELGESSLGWIVAVVLITIALAVATGFVKNKVVAYVSGGVSAVVLVLWIFLMSYVSREMISELGFHINIWGAGLYLLLITLAIEAALAIYAGVKNLI